MKKKVSESYGWEPTKNTQNEQCICCKEEIFVGPGVMCFISTQPLQRSHLCYKCHDEHVVTRRPLFQISRYRHTGRIPIEEKQSRAARSRELAKGHAVKV